MNRLYVIANIACLVLVISFAIVIENWTQAHSLFVFYSLSGFLQLLVLYLAGTLLVSVPVLWCAWNYIIVEVFETPKISYYQALSLTVAFYLVSALQCLPGN